MLLKTTLVKNDAATASDVFWTSVDGFIVEAIASFFVCSVCVMHWTEPDRHMTDWTIQFLPPLSWAFIMLSIHDREGWFPDTSSFMSLIQWALGSYTRWHQPLIRIAGQLLGMSLCIGMLSVSDFTSIDLTEQHEASHSVIIVRNIAATFLDHIAAMYIILPLLPFFSNPSNGNNTGANGISSNSSNSGPAYSLIRQRLHHHKPTNAANEANPAIPPQSTDRVALSALVFAGVHWTLWKTFASEMNPLVSFVIAVQREWQLGAYNEAAWARTGKPIGYLCTLYFVLEM